VHQGKTWSQDLEATRSLMKGLCLCTSWFFLPELSQAATSALIELHQPKHIERWVATNSIGAFWDISSQVCAWLTATSPSRASLMTAAPAGHDCPLGRAD